MGREKFEENKPYVTVGTIGHVDGGKTALIAAITGVQKALSDDTFVLVESSKLSLDDDFMNFKPREKETKEFKKELSEVIKKGVKDFYRPIMDTSLTKDSENIFFQAGNMPAVGKSYPWWEKVAKEFKPERGSRLGTKSEYIAFLGVLIKTLVNNGWPKAEAWNAVCIDSKELGCYYNSPNPLCGFADTGSRNICGFYDLANTNKILARDSDYYFWLASGCCHNYSYNYPIADLCYYHINDFSGSSSVGWIVLEK